MTAAAPPPGSVEVGRIALREEGAWWVAYYARPETMEGAHELARIRIGLVADHPQRRDRFIKLVQQAIADIVPEFRHCDAPRVAPEHERSGNG